MTVQPVAEAVLEMLRSAIPWPVGDHDPPDSTEGRYAIVHVLDGGTLFGTWAAPDEMATVPVQLASHGYSRVQCDLLADSLRTAMLARTGAGFERGLTPAGLRVVDRALQTPGASRPEGLDETHRQLWSRREGYLLTVVPG